MREEKPFRLHDEDTCTKKENKMKPIFEVLRTLIIILSFLLSNDFSAQTIQLKFFAILFIR